MLSRNLIHRGAGLACNAMSMLFRRGSFPVINCECSSPPGMRRTSFDYRNMLRSGMQACVIVFAISPLFFRPSCHRKITTWTEHITFPENNGDAHAQARQHPVPLLKHLSTNHGGRTLNCEPSNESVFSRGQSCSFPRE